MRRPIRACSSTTIPALCPKWKRPVQVFDVAVSSVHHCRWCERHRKHWNVLLVCKRCGLHTPYRQTHIQIAYRSGYVFVLFFVFFNCFATGLVFLQYRSETKRALLPNEITSIDTVRALFVRSFPRQLTMAYLEGPNVKIYIHDASKDMFYELEDVR